LILQVDVSLSKREFRNKAYQIADVILSYFFLNQTEVHLSQPVSKDLLFSSEYKSYLNLAGDLSLACDGPQFADDKENEMSNSNTDSKVQQLILIKSKGKFTF
jgi:hypothetical protein